MTCYGCFGKLYRFCEICEKLSVTMNLLMSVEQCKPTLLQVCITCIHVNCVYYGLCGVSVFRYTMEQRTERHAKISGCGPPWYLPRTYLSKHICAVCAMNVLSPPTCAILPRASPAEHLRMGLALFNAPCNNNN